MRSASPPDAPPPSGARPGCDVWVGGIFTLWHGDGVRGGSVAGCATLQSPSRAASGTFFAVNRLKCAVRFWRAVEAVTAQARQTKIRHFRLESLRLTYLTNRSCQGGPKCCSATESYTVPLTQIVALEAIPSDVTKSENKLYLLLIQPKPPRTAWCERRAQCTVRHNKRRVQC